MNRPAQAFQRIRSFVSSQVDVSRSLAQALQDRSINPYPYLKPIFEKAAGVREPPISPTPHSVVYTRGTMRLLRYAAPRRRHRTPILFVYSLINRWYILDFLPGRSLIEYLTRQGYDVYAIDWGFAGQDEQNLTWSELLGGHIRTAVRWTQRVSGSDDVTLYGYCMGGTMALAYTALHPEGVRNLVVQATPVDFSKGGIYSLWTQPQHFDVDSLVDAYGNVPTYVLESGFFMASPVQRITKWLDLCRQIDDPAFVTTFLALERWGADAVPFPGEVYRQYMRDCYQRNLFCQNQMEVGGERVDLGRIHCPVLNIIAEQDNIAPPAMSEPLQGLLVGTKDSQTMRFPVGHIGLSASSKSPVKVWPHIDGWMSQRSQPMEGGA
ncbi:MAG TPA: alpha/beta fold hydrolase [Archangium sp.]|nr:alpha/beta fold hydrolase [Archangium sp.]